MRVVLSAAFGGGAFYYAEQLDKRGYLWRWLTSRPDAWLARVNWRRVRVNPWPEVIHRVPLRIPWVRSRFPGDYFKATLFDAWAKNRISGGDVVVAFADFALETLRRARTVGVTTVLERGSAHILDQIELLTEEHDRLGVGEYRTSERLATRQLAEYEEAGFIAVPSRFAWQSYVNRGIPPERLILVPLGVDLDYFRPAAKEDGVFRILCVGGGARKGLAYLLRAVNELQLPRSELLIVGSLSPDESIQIGRANTAVISAGKIPHRKLSRYYYSRGSVFVSPSIEDGWGLVVSEAMACGLPVICSTHTGAADMVRNGVDGFVVPVRDVESLKERLLFLYENEDARRQMGRRAFERAQDFTWDAYGERIAAQYERILHTTGLEPRDRG